MKRREFITLLGGDGLDILDGGPGNNIVIQDWFI